MINKTELTVIILTNVILKCTATFLISHTDVELDLPALASSTTASSQICLHKCALSANCNVACVGKVAGSQFNCYFFNLAVTAKVRNRLRKRKDYNVYEVLKTKMETKVCIKLLRNFFNSKVVFSVTTHPIRFEDESSGIIFSSSFQKFFIQVAPSIEVD